MTKTDANELVDLVRAAMKELRVGSVWRHYKGGTYKITGFALDCDDFVKVMVLYTRIAGPGFNPISNEREITWSRSYDDWTSNVGIAGLTRPRFERCIEVTRYETEEEIQERG